jgi:hypothetical protein
VNAVSATRERGVELHTPQSMHLSIYWFACVSTVGRGGACAYTHMHVRPCVSTRPAYGECLTDATSEHSAPAALHASPPQAQRSSPRVHATRRFHQHRRARKLRVFIILTHAVLIQWLVSSGCSFCSLSLSYIYICIIYIYIWTNLVRLLHALLRLAHTAYACSAASINLTFIHECVYMNECI